MSCQSRLVWARARSSSLPPPLSNRGKMAAPSNAELSPDLSVPLKIPKTEVPSPESEDLSDSNQYHSNPSTPNRFSPLNVGVSLSGGAGRSGSASASNSFTACRGMSWTPSETNALIAVWATRGWRRRGCSSWRWPGRCFLARRRDPRCTSGCPERCQSWVTNGPHPSVERGWR